ncbi:hypothetical protein MKZ38_008157 [Zalerion maritima]|uniref:ER transporter 6TM N-terminal domain-containing protein n=1 Tax=Zalerion maritima TaxID=339359 RepID=A0AAD5RUB3_9PEZI|nr:hypothetical protein MKZ38_008157 [Zalerion maritima]
MIVQAVPEASQGSLVAACGRQFEALLSALRTNNLGRRVLKNTIATTITMIISVIPAVIRVFGPSTFLSPMTTVFAHPGQRLGMMVESQIMILVGTTLGMMWGLLGLYLSNFVFDEGNNPGAYSIRAVFLVLAILFHGYIRSSSPRLFNFVLYALVVSTLLLTKAPVEITPSLVTTFFYPILAANAVIIPVNVIIFPETASSFIGKSAIQSLFDTVNAMRDAGDWFIEEATGEDQFGRKSSAVSISAVQAAKLANLTERKAKLRMTLAACKKAQAECNFELSYSVLPPRYLKPVSTTGMTSLVQSTIALIGACESKYALVGDTQGNQPEEVGPLFAQNPCDAIPEEDENGRPRAPLAKTPSGDRPNPPKPHPKSKVAKPDIAEKLKLVKPTREVESGDAEILELILIPVRKPITDLKLEIDKAIDVVSAALSYSYDIRKLPSGWVPPDGLRPEEIDIRIELFDEAIDTFDQTSADALASAAALEDLESPDVDIMPRMETFLISSFLLSLRQAAMHAMIMLRHSRTLVEKRAARHDKRRFYFPRKIIWRKWLASGGEEDNSALPENARKGARRGVERRSRVVDDDSDTSDEEEFADEGPLLGSDKMDVEAAYIETVASIDLDEKEARKYEKRKEAKKEDKIRRRAYGPKPGSIAWFRDKTANLFEGITDDENLAYAMKMATALILVTWPAFVDTWKPWYSDVRGVWAPLQLIMVFEVSIGTSFWVFFVRLFGVITGCLWGFLAYQIGQGNPYVLCIICMLGVVPGAYVQVGTRYVKAGMIGIISMAVVALVSYSKDTAAWEIFVQRLVAFIIGGTFAMMVEITLYPVRARDRLVECLSSCLSQMSNMQAAIAVGVDDPRNMDLHSPLLYNRFRDAKDKAQSALAAAETFLPFCLSEPRLKGSFKMIAPVYREIIYVLHQIIDRMDNMLALRKAYGTSVLEELNEVIFAHRRNVAAAVTLTFFAVNEALVTRMPLPQFLPSSRLAQLRLVNKVRHSLMEKSSSSQNVAPLVMTTVTSWDMGEGGGHGQQLELSKDMVTSVTQQKFLAWNAAAAGQIELIEYLEELVDLAKLLVGVNAFKSGMLERPSYVEYVKRLREKELAAAKGEAVEKAKETGADAEEMIQAVENVDADARNPSLAPPGPGRLSRIGTGMRRSSSFTSGPDGGGMKRRFTFAPGPAGAGAAGRSRSGSLGPGAASARDATSPDPSVYDVGESFRSRFNAGRLEKRSTRLTRQGSSYVRRPYWEEEGAAGGSGHHHAFREEDEDEENAAQAAAAGRSGGGRLGVPSPAGSAAGSRSRGETPSGEFRRSRSLSRGGRSSERKPSGEFPSLGAPTGMGLPPGLRRGRRSSERDRRRGGGGGEQPQPQTQQQNRQPLVVDGPGQAASDFDPRASAATAGAGAGPSAGSGTPRDDIPISLRRVRTRMEERSVERRRRLTLLQPAGEASTAGSFSGPSGSGAPETPMGGGHSRTRRAGLRPPQSQQPQRPQQPPPPAPGAPRRSTMRRPRGEFVPGPVQSRPTFGPAARMSATGPGQQGSRPRTAPPRPQGMQTGMAEQQMSGGNGGGAGAGAGAAGGDTISPTTPPLPPPAGAAPGASSSGPGPR